MKKRKKSENDVIKTFRCLYGLLTGLERKRIIYLAFFMLLCACIEFISVGSLFPYIKIISDPGVIQRNHQLHSVYTMLHFSNNYQFIIFVGVLILLIMVVKVSVGMFNNYIQALFSAKLKNRIAIELFKSFMFMPCSELASQKTTFYSKYLLYDVENFFAVVAALLKVISNTLMLTALIVLLFVINPGLLMVSIGLLGALVLLSIKSTKRKFLKLGKESEKAYRYLYRTVDESLKGVKDIKIFLKENYFIDRFSILQKKLSHIKVIMSVFANMPTAIINTLGFGIMLGAVLVLFIVHHGNIVTILPTMAIIALSVQRLLPTLTLITTSLGTVRTYSIVVYKLHEIIHQEKSEDAIKDKTQQQIAVCSRNLELKNVTFSYDDRGVILDNVSLKIEKNSIVGIVGKSGSGKSTLVDLILGLYHPDEGAVLCDGVPVGGSLLENYQGRIAYVSQAPFILDATLKENIAFGIEQEDLCLDKLNSAIRVAQLSEVVNEFENGINEELGEAAVKLSGGQKQRIGIARALYTDADILIFDESTSALDLETEVNFYAALKQWANKTKIIFLISHRKTLLDYCDQVVVMNNKSIIHPAQFEKNGFSNIEEILAEA